VPLLMIMFAAASRRRRVGADEFDEPEMPREEFEDVKRAAREDLLALADQIRELDIEIELPGVNSTARADYARALDLYERAARAFDRARGPADLRAVSAALEEGRFAMVSARARLEGREPPERRPPCFFDPRHGPSVREVEWAPPYGALRRVPVCAADAIRIEEGVEPHAREVPVGGRRVPYWDAPVVYAPYAGGYFGGFAGVLPGLLFGSMLGSAFGVGAAELGWGGADTLGEGEFEPVGGDFAAGDFPADGT